MKTALPTSYSVALLCYDIHGGCQKLNLDARSSTPQGAARSVLAKARKQNPGCLVKLYHSTGSQAENLAVSVRQK